MPITHAFVSGIEDGADETLVRPSNWNADHVLGTGEVLPLKVVKASDETVNNSAVLQNDDHLLMAVGANEVWLVEIFLLGITDGTAEFKFMFTAPTGATFSWRFMGKDAANTIVDNNYFEVGSSQTVWGAGATIRVQAKGIVICGGTAGNLQLQWAQNAATAVDTKVLANSCLIAHKLS